LFTDRVERILKFEIENINNHLPKKRLSLVKAIEGQSNYISKDNTPLYIDKEEVKLLASLCPKEKIPSVFLPIIILRRRDLGEGVFVVGGELIDKYLVFKTIDKWQGDWKEFLAKHTEKEVYLYRPDILSVRKKLPTCTAIGFT